MPHSAKSSRSNLTGAAPKKRGYAQGASDARKNAATRAQLLHTSTSLVTQPLGKPTGGARLLARNFTPSVKKGPRIIRWANEEQEAAFNYGPYPLMASGGFGAGKTYALCLKAMYLSDLYPGNRGLIARKQGEKLKKTTMKTFFKVCPPEAYLYGSRSDQAKSLTLNNGSEILWSQLDDSEIIELLRGLEINWFLIDQAEEVSEEIIEVLMRRLGRWDQAEVPQWLIDREVAAGREWPWWNKETGRALPPTYAMFACNPDHELHWIYRRFHPESPEWKETYSKQGYKMINFDSTKNLFLPDQNKEALLQGTKEFVARFVRGEWGIPEGQIHKIDPMSLLKWSPELEEHLKTCKKSRTLDHGETSPTCCLWWALDKWGNLFCYQEYYQPDRLISYHRERIYELSLKKVTSYIGGSTQEEYVPEHFVSDLADPSIFNPRTQRGVSVSVAEEYYEVNEAATDKHTSIWWQRGDNNELGTRNRINEFLRLDPAHRHPITGKMGAPRLYFIERTADYPYGCVEVLRETRSQRRVKIGTKDGQDVFSDDRDESIVDHAYDCFSGDTEVLTPDGPARIQDLPESGIVMTPAGFKPYHHAQKYRYNAEVMEVELAGGVVITATPDHLFMTPEGWTRADALTNKTQCVIMNAWTPSSSPQSSSHSSASSSISADTTSSGKESGFTGLSGNTTMGRSLKATTSTTVTRTGQITESPTSNASLGRLTYRPTAKASLIQRLWQQCKKLLKRGTGVLRGESGTSNTRQNHSAIPTSAMSASSAKCAPQSTSQPAVDRVSLASVGTGAKLPPTASLIPITTVRKRSNADVYCLTVDDIGAFCVAGGVVVHNCLRYRLADMDALPVEAIRRPAPGTVAHTIAEFKKADKKPRRRDNTSRLADLQRSVPRLAAFYRSR